MAMAEKYYDFKVAWLKKLIDQNQLAFLNVDQYSSVYHI